MSKPVKKTTRMKTGVRRSHLAMKQVTTRACEKCGTKNIPHTACTDCGNYRGRSVK